MSIFVSQLCFCKRDIFSYKTNQTNGNIHTLSTLAPSSGSSTHLLAIVGDRRQDGAKRLETHCYVQQMCRKEEVVEVSKNGHGGIPDQIQEVLEERDRVKPFFSEKHQGHWLL